MILSLEDKVINQLEVDIINADTESPDTPVKVVANNTSFNASTYKPSSVATVSLFIILGMLAFFFAIMYKSNKKNKLTQYVVDVKSCYINYGSTNIQLPQFMTQLSTFQEKSDLKNFKLKTCKKEKKYIHKIRWFNTRQSFRGFGTKQMIMVSDLWKAKSQQSNNFFIINIIPEEDELQEGAV